LITHDPQDVLMLSDHVIRIQEGRVVADCAPDELVAQQAAAWASGEARVPAMA
jgi:energy-coupling factor transporter ATP-binding protein EcfA2